MTRISQLLLFLVLLSARPMNAQEELTVEEPLDSAATEASIALVDETDADLPLEVEEFEKQIVGWVENVNLEDSDLLVRAKLDTGADTSSLDVRYTRLFKLNRQRMVRFEIENPDTDERVTFERPVVRMVRIKQHGGGYLRRPVVLMRVCLGNRSHEVEMSLADRSNFQYSMLLGRSALRNVAIIDPSETNLNTPDCEEEEIYD